MTRRHRTDGLLRIQLFLDRDAHRSAEQPVFRYSLKPLGVCDRLERIAVAHIHDERGYLCDFGFCEAVADQVLIGFWQERFGQGDTPGS